MKGKLGRDEFVVVAIVLVLCLVGIGWGLPGYESWSADSVSPRASGLFAIAETYWPGHYHRYPPLHLGLLTVLALPFIAVAALRVGFSASRLEAELIRVPYMTGIEIASRLLTIVMAVGIAIHAMRLWTRLQGRRAGWIAGLAIALNSVFVYYAHTGNLEIPYLFWSSWALVEIDRVLAGERRELHAMVLATCAVLTKDQAAGIFLLTIPVFVLGPSLLDRERRRGTLKGLAVAVFVYAVVSGAVTNPSGFARRLAVIFGPASQDWAEFPKTAAGMKGLTTALFNRLPEFSGWPLAIVALIGAVLAIGLKSPSHSYSAFSSLRARRLVPCLGAVSFALFFTFGARRSEHRFVLPLMVLLLPYAAIVIDTIWEKQRGLGMVIACIVFAPAAIATASVDATLVTDSRYAAERFLGSLAAGAKIDIYGGPKFFPRFPAQVEVTRVGVEPLESRSPIPNVTEVVVASLQGMTRAPDYIVLSAEFSREPAPVDALEIKKFEVAAYADVSSRRFFAELVHGALPYARVFDAHCNLSWPLYCRDIHGSLGGQVWIYKRVE